MSFSIRPSRRFPGCCPLTYHCGLFEGQGTVWNLSLTGWRFTGNLPLRIGEVCSLTVNLPTQPRLYVAAGITILQFYNLLERLGRIIEMGLRRPKGTTH